MPSNLQDKIVVRSEVVQPESSHVGEAANRGIVTYEHAATPKPSTQHNSEGRPLIWAKDYVSNLITRDSHENINRDIVCLVRPDVVYISQIILQETRNMGR